MGVCAWTLRGLTAAMNPKSARQGATDEKDPSP